MGIVTPSLGTAFRRTVIMGRLPDEGTTEERVVAGSQIAV